MSKPKDPLQTSEMAARQYLAALLTTQEAIADLLPRMSLEARWRSLTDEERAVFEEPPFDQELIDTLDEALVMLLETRNRYCAADEMVIEDAVLSFDQSDAQRKAGKAEEAQSE